MTPVQIYASEEKRNKPSKSELAQHESLAVEYINRYSDALRELIDNHRRAIKSFDDCNPTIAYESLQPSLATIEAVSLDVAEEAKWWQDYFPKREENEYLTKNLLNLRHFYFTAKQHIANYQFAAGYSKSALSTYDQLLLLNPPPIDFDIEEIKRANAQAMTWSGKYEEAALYYNALPQSFHKYLMLGRIALAKRQTESFLDDCKKCLEMADSESQKLALLQLAVAHALACDGKAAEETLEKVRVIATTANQPYLHLYSGIVALLTRDYLKANAELAVAEATLIPKFKYDTGQVLLWRYFAATASGDTNTAKILESKLQPYFESYPLLKDMANNYSSDFANKGIITGRDKDRPANNIWVLIIGISEFNSSDINLKYAAKDASDFSAYLQTKGVPVDHIKCLLNKDATRANIMDAVGDSWLPKVCGEDDVAVVYVSTHGTPSNKDIGSLNYFVAHDTDKFKLYSTAVSMQTFTDLIGKRLKTDRILFILDTCYSAGLGQVGGQSGNISTRRFADLTGQVILCSSDLNERSWESKSAANGVFTRYLLSVLNNSSFNSLQSMFSELRNKVAQEVKTDYNAEQHPQLAGTWGSRELVLQILKGAK